MEIAPTIRRVTNPLEIMILWIVRGIVLGLKMGFVAGGCLGLLFFIVGALWGAPFGAFVGALAGLFYGTLIGITLAVSVARGRINPKGNNWRAQSRKTAMRSVNVFVVALVSNLLIWRNSPVVALTLVAVMSFYPVVLWGLAGTGVPTWGSLTWGEGDSSKKHKAIRAAAKLELRKRDLARKDKGLKQ